jgi:hypothetical protein
VSNEGFTLNNSDSETKTVLRTKIKKAAALPLGLWKETVAQWLLADRTGGTETFKSLIEKLRQREAGWQQCHRKNTKHANTPRI